MKGHFRERSYGAIIYRPERPIGWQLLRDAPSLQFAYRSDE